MKAAINKFTSFFWGGGLKETVMRFPVSSFCAAALFVTFILNLHDVINDDTGFGRLGACLVTGYFWFGGMRLMAESRGVSFMREMAAGFLVFIPFCILMALADDFGLYLVFIIPALLLFLMVAPYAHRLKDRESDLSFWKYNCALWIGVLVSFLVIIIMTGGLHAAFMSIEALFAVKMPFRMMEDIWAFSAILVGPVYALASVPTQFTYGREEISVPRALAFLLNWILAPLILIYFLILYAYLVKVLVTQELPLGVLAYMVTGFAGVGIAAYLIGLPMQEQSSGLIRKIFEWFFAALAIPVIMQFIAIGERIYTFGVTEQRYMVALSAVWLAALIGIFTFRKAASLKIIPALLAALLLAAAFGPWGAVGLSGVSQKHRLEQLLVKHDILRDGKIVKTDKEIPFEDRVSISSKVMYLEDTGRLKNILPWFDKKYSENFNMESYDSNSFANVSYPLTYELIKEMGFEYQHHYSQPVQEKGVFNLQGKGLNIPLVPVGGYDFVSLNQFANAIDPKPSDYASGIMIKEDVEAGTPDIRWLLDRQSILHITVAGRGEVLFDLKPLVMKNKENLTYPDPRELSLEQAGEGVKIRLVFNHISGKITDEDIRVENVSFAMLLDL